MVNSPGFPRLKGPTCSPSINRISPSTKSETYWKLLVCLPSPYTVIGSFLKACSKQQDYSINNNYTAFFHFKPTTKKTPQRERERESYHLHTCATKLLTTRPSSMHIRGPYVLNILAILTCSFISSTLFNKQKQNPCILLTRKVFNWFLVIVVASHLNIYIVLSPFSLLIKL